MPERATRRRLDGLAQQPGLALGECAAVLRPHRATAHRQPGRGGDAERRGQPRGQHLDGAVGLAQGQPAVRRGVTQGGGVAQGRGLAEPPASDDEGHPPPRRDPQQLDHPRAVEHSGIVLVTRHAGASASGAGTGRIPRSRCRGRSPQPRRVR
ncbi:hypothetical protein [Pseudonocardia abyssalis]|uniref:Uncharacterized protein n=1 Tax=Pseudonocardia abyssalis TaxID=2792008 RepID=A0ABS6UXT1_9PSEU|nr:hypothetical protein [Pseudonocardia abyssalis]MBW0114844.1 hypothetical protein [Pseudonocardia abyssalis]MBW0137034.1 hypothetical protein [Pseudonocardia abyssalis]